MTSHIKLRQLTENWILSTQESCDVTSANYTEQMLPLIRLKPGILKGQKTEESVLTSTGSHCVCGHSVDCTRTTDGWDTV